MEPIAGTITRISLNKDARSEIVKFFSWPKLLSIAFLTSKTKDEVLELNGKNIFVLLSCKDENGNEKFRRENMIVNFYGNKNQQLVFIFGGVIFHTDIIL